MSYKIGERADPFAVVYLDDRDAVRWMVDHLPSGDVITKQLKELYRQTEPVDVYEVQRKVIQAGYR